MHPPVSPRILRLLAALGAVLAVSAFSLRAETVLYSQNFNDPNSATAASDFGWAGFVGGSPSSPSVNSSASTTTGGIFNAERVLHLNLNTTAATTSWFGGLRYTYANPLPTLDLSQLALRARVYAGGSTGPRGDVVLRIESSNNNWIGFSISGAALTGLNGQRIGGLLSAPTATAGTFDSSASSFTITVAFANTIATWGNDASNIVAVDDVVFAQGPFAPVITDEPDSQTVTEGSPITLSLVATGTGPFTYAWSRGATPLDVTGPTLEIAAVALADAGDYTCVVTGPGGTDTSAVATVTVLTRYAAWSSQIPWAGADASDTADADGDAASNLLEYALGTDPLSAASVAIPNLSLAGDTSRALALTFDRIADPRLIYVVEASNDLSTWAPIWTSTGAQNVAGAVTVTDPEAIEGTPRRFLRLSVTP